MIGDDGYCSLPEAITAANTNAGYLGCLAGDPGMDTIEFTGGVTGTIPLYAAMPVITEDLTINGPGAGVLTIDGSNNTAFIFQVGQTDSDYNTVTISGLTLSGASGAAIYVHSYYNDLHLSASIVTANSGSGIINYGKNVYVDNSEISWNDTSYEGGGIRNRGYLYVSNSIIANNSALYGGGIAQLLEGYTWIRNDSIIRDNDASFGGGIYQQGGQLFISHSTIGPGNEAYMGGGIHNRILLDSATSGSGQISITNSTVSGNTADYGGGIYRLATDIKGAAILFNVTIANNTSVAVGEPGGGGILVEGYSAILPTYIVNSIIADNHVNTAGGATGPDCVGIIDSLGYNIIGNSEECYGTDASDQIDTDPMLGPLQDNGGPTLTHALLADSPAIDAGVPTGCRGDHDQDPLTPAEELTQDQRGSPRPLDGDGDGTAVCDSGAYEFILPQEIEVSDSVAPVDDLQIHFGEVPVGKSQSEIITVSNIGGQPLQITDVQIVGADTTDFSYDLLAGSNPCGTLTVELNGSESCTVRVDFVPKSEGNKTVNVDLSSNDTDEPTITITLSGIAMPKVDDNATGDTTGGGGGGGCSLQKKGEFDPLLPAMLLVALVYLRYRRRQEESGTDHD